MSQKASEQKEKRKPVWTIKRGNVTVPAYLYKDGRFCLAYRKVAGGKRILETFRDEEDAKRRAREIATSIANAHADILELTSADKEMYMLARQQTDALGIPLHAAIEEWAAAKKILAGHSLIEAANFYHRGYVTRTVCPTAKVVVLELLNQIADDRRSEKYTSELRKDLERYAAVLPDLTATTEDDIRGYLRNLKTVPLNDKDIPRPVSLRRRDNVRNAIVRLFRFARERDYLPADRTTVAEKIPKQAEGTEVSTYTPEALKKLLAAVDKKFLPWMLLGAFAGLRTSEIWRLDWSAIKWDHKVIAVPRSVARKVRTARKPPISDNLMAWLSRYRNMTGPIYPELPNTLEDLHFRELRRLQKATKIRWEANALRHSFGSYRLAIVKSVDQVALEMGNSPEKVRQNYNDPKSEAEAKAYFAIMPEMERAKVIRGKFSVG